LILLAVCDGLLPLLPALEAALSALQPGTCTVVRSAG
jgi:hypothetical protein